VDWPGVPCTTARSASELHLQWPRCHETPYAISVVTQPPSDSPPLAHNGDLAGSAAAAAVSAALRAATSRRQAASRSALLVSIAAVCATRLALRSAAFCSVHFPLNRARRPPPVNSRNLRSSSVTGADSGTAHRRLDLARQLVVADGLFAAPDGKPARPAVVMAASLARPEVVSSAAHPLAVFRAPAMRATLGGTGDDPDPAGRRSGVNQG